jgi:hypothetical protein
MPADDGLRCHFGRERIDSIVSTKLAAFGGGPAYATEASDQGAVTAPTHASSIELAHSHAPVLTEEQLTSREYPTHTGTGATTIGHGKGHAAAAVEPTELGVTAPSTAIASAAAAIVGSSVTTGNDGGNGNSQHASNPAAAKAATADLTEPDGTTGNGGSHGNSQHASNSAAAKAAAIDPTEHDGTTGNSGGHGNSQHALNSAAAKAAAIDPTEPDGTTGNGGGHGQTFHFNNQVAPLNNSPVVEQAPGDPHVFLGHGAALADIETGPPGGEESLPSHANNGQHNSIGHSHHELLV